MPKTVDIPGTGVVEFPDSMSDDQISSAIQSQHQSTPAPPGVPRPPLPHGLSTASDNPSAAPGSIDRLQSNPSLGAMGGMMTRAADPQAAGQVLKEEGKGIALGASVVAPIVTGGASIPIQALVNAASGGVQSAVTGGSAKQVATSTVLGGGLGALSGTIPRASQAIQMFKQLAKIGPKSEVAVSAAAGPASQIMEEAAAGGSMPKVVRNFLSRMTDPGKPPLTYEEARRFYSNASRVSADENMRLTDNMKRLLGNFREGLHQDITANRAQFGVAEQYKEAMNTFSRAKKFEGGLDTINGLAKKSAERATIGAGTVAGGAAGYELYKAVTGGHGR